MGRNAWIIFIIVVIGLLSGLVIYSRMSNPSADVSKVDVLAVQKASDDNGRIGDHTYDASDGKITLIEYGDFQCPYCGQAHPQVRTILDEYGSVVTFVFRNFPITSAHANAKAAAAAAEAVALQGNDLYWKMHDTLYQNQPQWQSLTGNQRTSQFAAYAESIGVDIDKYNAALADGAPKVNKKINFDLALAKKQDVSSTPTFYLNGKALSSDVTADLQQAKGDKLRAALDEALKEAGLSLPKEDSKTKS